MRSFIVQGQYIQREQAYLSYALFGSLADEIHKRSEFKCYSDIILKPQVIIPSCLQMDFAQRPLDIVAIF